MNTYDIVVIGAGYAGLTATRHLLKANKNVLLLEARDRVGGRVFTQNLDSGTYVDLGGAWIGPTQDRIYALAREFGVETFPTYDAGKSTQYFRGKIKRYGGLIPPLPIGALLSLDAAIKRMNKLAKSINLAAPWQSPNANHWDAMTLASWMHQQMSFQTARDFFKVAAEAIWAADPADISMLHALFYVQSAGSLELLMNIKGGAQEERIVGGAQTIANKMAATFADKICFNSPVKTILQEGAGVKIIAKEKEYGAKKVIVAIPPTLAGRIDYQPIMPANRDSLTQRMPMGSVWKTYAIYDKPFWRDAGLNALVATPNGYITVTFDNSPKDGSKGILMGFVLGNQAKAFSELSAAQRRQEALAAFTTFFGKKAQNPVQYLDHSWATEEWSRGCYAGVMPPGVWTSVGKTLRAPVGHIHWAGTETAEVWNGYIEGAVRSGERVAKEILECLA
ncbi:MAG: flavin monoamine oxidase family protein [Runella slithyformis]|nr:MAG: flavin monoamine oxidase family protein [Runella slithyformis]TAF02292.1 MAG: flavin monoamine oxidase family protein [Runella slithyformis]TAF29976.1 MAG: flavin monoamine oxidase family protein [Runella slithyformis]TAF49092.1 MAG: flavin monoamine oxidase family protein [Runella slithyformis]TAF83587.1 MAG: flavin monoamine oxidase family protein [Runella slithyformis]